MFPWLPLFCAVLSVLCLLLVSLYCNSLEQKNFVEAIIEKTAASLCFTILGLIAAFLHPGRPFVILILVGLIFGMIGDILLVFRYRYAKGSRSYFRWFVTGTVSFLLGHICYILAALIFQEKNWTAIILYTLFGFFLTWHYTKSRQVDFGKRIVGGVLYLTFVVFMGACALGVAVSSDSFALWLFALGGLCFVFSDNMLVVNSFGPAYSDRRSAALHYLYWTAQLLIAFSILI